MRISDWSSDVCSSDLREGHSLRTRNDPLMSDRRCHRHGRQRVVVDEIRNIGWVEDRDGRHGPHDIPNIIGTAMGIRSEEHTSELQSLMRISYAVFCLKKQNNKKNKTHIIQTTSRTQQTNK